jgi:uncharacterized protein (TIGR03083 family)
VSGRADYLDALAQGRDRLLSAAARAGLGARVPTAPRWALGELVVHVGNVHDWAGAVLRTGVEQPQEFDEAPTGGGGGDGAGLAALLAWYAGRADALIALLDSGVPGEDEPCWTFGPPATAGFWARRQAHELAIHALDAELAAGDSLADALASLSPELSADGVDEVLSVMLPRIAQFRPRPALGAPLEIVATDVGRRWILAPDGQLSAPAPSAPAAPSGAPGPAAPVGSAGPAGPSGLDDPASAQLLGAATALHALLWRRARLDSDAEPLGVSIEGDPAVVAALFGARLTP